MQTTCDFLDAVKTRFNLPSDYALAAKLGISRAMLSHYRLRHDTFSDSVALTVAKLLEIDPAIMLVNIQAERCRQPVEKAVWESILQKLGGAAAALVLALGVVAPGQDARAADAPLFDNNTDNLQIMRSKKNRRKRQKVIFPMPFLWGDQIHPI